MMTFPKFDPKADLAMIPSVFSELTILPSSSVQIIQVLSPGVIRDFLVDCVLLCNL